MADSTLKNATATQLELSVEEDLYRAMSTLPGSSMVRINCYLWKIAERRRK